MRVRMLVPISGTRNGSPWPAVGETVDLPDHEATDLVAAGHAEPATGAKKRGKAIEEKVT